MNKDKREKLEKWAAQIRLTEEEIRGIRARLNRKSGRDKDKLFLLEKDLINKVYVLKEKFWAD